MRILAGTKVIEAPGSWRQALQGDGRRVVIDVGAGDGRFVYESARHDQESVYIALDPDAAALATYAYRAARKPARGGVANALFVVAALEQLPPDLSALADLVRVNFPWGGLLRGLLQPEPAVLRALAALARPAGRFEIILSYDPAHEPLAWEQALPLLPSQRQTESEAEDSPPPVLNEAYIDTKLAPAYAAAGLAVAERRRLAREEALAIPSTWGRRLLHARPRDVFLLRGSVSGGTRSANLGEG